MKSNNILLLYCTFPTKEEAETMARELVEDGLIACANVTNVESIYRWDNEIQDEKESLLLGKTREENKDEVKARLEADHPYDVPAIVFYEAKDSSEKYNRWLKDVC